MKKTNNRILKKKNKFRLDLPENFPKNNLTAAEYQKLITKIEVHSDKLNSNQLTAAPGRIKRKHSNLEHQIQSEYFDKLKNIPEVPELDFIFAIPNGGKRNIVTAMKMKKEGVKRGVPDIMIPIVKNNSPGMFLETKTPEGTESKYQIRYRKFLLSQGYQHKICRSAKELLDTTLDYLEISN